ncbi:hypothetical protein [Peterkaempfera sp. SMS 1(5)a]|uniref:hypothetical protein n=1 Tax=Peterkaempfera podocarpi TaxID=3232308 RepID=UPI00366E0AFB
MTSRMTLGVYIRTGDGRTLRLRPTGPVAPVTHPDVHSGLRFPPCRCPRHAAPPQSRERI